jgi:two-component system, NarL family, sensor histidine kinase EvgS
MILALVAVTLWETAVAAQSKEGVLSETTTASVPGKKPFVLTEIEKKWLREQGDIRVGIMNAWPPMSFVDATGQKRGIDVELIIALNRRLNGVLKISSGPWKSIYEGLKNKSLDVLMGVTPRDDRAPYFNFTDPYLVIPHVIFGRRDEKEVLSLETLSGRSVAVEDNFFLASLLEKMFPRIKVKSYKTTSDALQAVSNNEASAYIGNRAAALYIIRNESISNLKQYGKISETASINAIGVRKDWPVLQTILQRALHDISLAERRVILGEWISTDIRRRNEFDLTQAEKDWIAAHPVIRVAGDKAWAPIEFLERNGEFSGLAVDYLAKIGELLGVKFEYDRKSSWLQVTKKMKARTLDMYSAVAPFEERREYATFTKPYLNMPAVIFTRSDLPFSGGLESLRGRRVAVVGGYAIADYLTKGNQGLNLVYTASVDEGLRLLQQKDVDAYIGGILVTGHYIRLAGYTNITVSGHTPFTLRVAMATRSDWPVFNQILQKALTHVGENEHAGIIGKWVGLTIKTPVDYRLLWQISLAVGLTLLTLLIWNWRLRVRSNAQSQEITENNKALRQEVVERIKAEESALLASRVKDSFMANVSHEFRTPLNAILGFSEMIQVMNPDPENDKLRKVDEYSKYIYESGGRLLSVFEDVVTISSIYADDGSILREELGVGKILKDAIQAHEDEAKAEGVEFSEHIPSEPLLVMGDKRSIRRIFDCLLSNAVNFNQPNGSVEISARDRGSEIHVTIEDTGVGISESSLKHITDPFFRSVENPYVTSEKGEGTSKGLGLTIVKSLITAHQGEMKIESQEDVGTKVTVIIPVEGDLSEMEATLAS